MKNLTLRGEGEKMYLIQAILIDDTGRNTIETVVNSIKSDDYNTAIEFLMKKHKNSTHYLYRAIEIENQQVVASTTENKFAW